MTGSAQREILPQTAESNPESAQPFALTEPSILKLEVAEKLAVHRQRRAGMQKAQAAARQLERNEQGRANRVAEAVAERYAQTPSYRAFLAEEAERAIQQATAAAEIAARNAEAVAAAQHTLLKELELWDAPQAFTASTAAVVASGFAKKKPKLEVVAEQEAKPAGEVTVRLYEDLGPLTGIPAAAPRQTSAAEARESRALDEEIAFRQSPVFEDFRSDEPAVPLPANVMAFPRQLVAAVKARPRLAEGPLREDPAAKAPQLRIFEVEAEQIATAPEPISMIPEWSSIWLDAHIATEVVDEHEAPAPDLLPSLLPPETAALHLRVMAGGVDVLLVLAGFVAFAAAAAWAAGSVVLGAPVFVGAAFALGLLYAAYQLLFFSLCNQTPGMRYARIGLCTFTNEYPSRAAMRKRVLAQAVAAAPLGLGLAWALLDEDRLGWHDRMSRMYQRSY